MKYLIDTDVLIDNLRKKSRLDKEIIEGGAATSIINLGELVYGALKSRDPKKTLETTENFLTDLKMEIIGLEKEIIYVFAKIKADLEMKGQRLDDFDLLIAATAIVNNLTLVTRNRNHFKRIKNLKLAP